VIYIYPALAEIHRLSQNLSKKISIHTLKLGQGITFRRGHLILVAELTKGASSGQTASAGVFLGADHIVWAMCAIEKNVKSVRQ
jgi:hypothetical protein